MCVYQVASQDLNHNPAVVRLWTWVYHHGGSEYVPGMTTRAFRHLAVVVVLLVTAALTACASDDGAPPTADPAMVREVVRAWVVAVADGDAARACGLMTELAQQQLSVAQSTSDCPAAVRRLSGALGPAGRDGLRGIGVDRVEFPAPDRALAHLGDRGQRLELRRAGGGWRVSDVTQAIRGGNGGAYPPPTGSFLPSPPPGVTPSG